MAVNQESIFDRSLPFEKRIIELERQLAATEVTTERQTIEEELEAEQETVFSGLTAWQRVQLARHVDRPRLFDYVSRVFEDFIELHGDRAVGDDPAMVGGIARFDGQTVIVVGQDKGSNTEERGRRNFGMAHPEGYRKALRLFHLAERLGLPIISIVDTSGAAPGIEAEARGQGPCIAQNLLEMLGIASPILSVIIAEGGSGGALGIAVADWVSMFEYSVYNICAPERCAEILWRDIGKKELAASALRLSAHELLDLGVIDNVLKEPGGGAHRSPDGAAESLRNEIAFFLQEAKAGRWSREHRQEKFRQMGIWQSAPPDEDD